MRINSSSSVDRCIITTQITQLLSVNININSIRPLRLDLLCLYFLYSFTLS